MTQHSDAGEARTRCTLVSSQALYQLATALPNVDQLSITDKKLGLYNCYSEFSNILTP